MTALSLAGANEVYACSGAPRVQRHAVEHDGFGRYCAALDRFRRSLGELSGDELWRAWLYRLYAYRSALQSAPLPFCHAAACDEATQSMLAQQCRKLELIYGSFAPGARELLTAFHEISRSVGNPLLDAVRTIQLSGIQGGAGTALLIQEPRLLAPAEAELAAAGLARIEAVTPASLRRGVRFRRIIAIGPSHRFPAYVVTAPRAPELHFVHYRWVTDRGHPVNVFPRSGAAAARPVAAHADQAPAGTAGGEQDFPPQLNWRDMSERALRGHAPAAPHDEADARLVLLEGHTAVFLEADASALAIDLDATDDSRVARLPLSAIAPGMLVLLRTEGGSDYIVPLANRILGDMAPAARERQAWWKGLLRSESASRGLLATSVRLIELGSELASPWNVRNWMSSRSIRTERYSDFLAIMRLIGVGDQQAGEYWKLMGLIRRAHNKAGFHIRRLLLAKVLECDLDELERRGRMDFALAESGAGTLTAFRIVRVSPETVAVPSSRIGHPFELEAPAWHA